MLCVISYVPILVESGLMNIRRYAGLILHRYLLLKWADFIFKNDYGFFFKLRILSVYLDF